VDHWRGHHRRQPEGAVNALTLQQPSRPSNFDTIILLLGMMIVVAIFSFRASLRWWPSASLDAIARLPC